MANNKNERTNCTSCRRKFEMGVDVLALEEGVIGGRGFVPLEDVLFFCSEKCLRQHLADDGYGMAERIP